MIQKKMAKYRRMLDAMDLRLQGDITALEEVARTGLGADSGESGAPTHLGDLGTEQFFQELNATLFENEEFIRLEVRDALGRLDRDTYGICERCSKEILEERLEALPYTRYCTPCSAAVGDGAQVNLNEGRSVRMDGPERRHAGEEGDGERTRPDDPDRPFTDAAPKREA